MTNEGTPATGPGSNRYKRYEDAGVEEIIPTGERKESDLNDVDRTPQSDAEQQRLDDQRYRNLNQGIPLHRGADQETHDAVVKGQHGRNRSEAEIEAEEKRRDHSNLNQGIPVDHVGVPKENRDRLREAAKAELEVE